MIRAPILIFVLLLLVAQICAIGDDKIMEEIQSYHTEGDVLSAVYLKDVKSKQQDYDDLVEKKNKERMEILKLLEVERAREKEIDRKIKELLAKEVPHQPISYNTQVLPINLPSYFNDKTLIPVFMFTVAVILCGIIIWTTVDNCIRRKDINNEASSSDKIRHEVVTKSVPSVSRIPRPVPRPPTSATSQQPAPSSQPPAVKPQPAPRVAKQVALKHAPVAAKPAIKPAAKVAPAPAPTNPF